MVRQIGINRVRVSWTPPPNPPSKGYRITANADFGVGISVASTASSHDVGQTPGTTVSYYLITLYGTVAVVGLVRFTLRGEEMCTYYTYLVYSSIITMTVTSYIIFCLQTDFSTPMNITSSSLTATSATISWTQPPFSLPMDEYRVELRQVTGARQLCQEVEDYKSKMTTRGAVSVDFTSLHEFSIYQVTILIITISGFNATLTPTVEFTTKAAGMDICTLHVAINNANGLLYCRTYCSPTQHKLFLYHLQKC